MSPIARIRIKNIVHGSKQQSCIQKSCLCNEDYLRDKQLLGQQWLTLFIFPIYLSRDYLLSRRYLLVSPSRQLFVEIGDDYKTFAEFESRIEKLLRSSVSTVEMY